MPKISLASAALAALLAAPAALAAPAVGLMGDRTLVTIDTDTGAVTRTVEVRGVDALLGIDWRPADGKVWGLATDGRLVTIDPATGAVTLKATLDHMPMVGAAPVVVDFNPAADKLRVISGTMNYRVDPDAGKLMDDKPLAFEAGDMNAGRTPMVVAGAYINSFGKPEKAKLYNIDAGLGALLWQTVPNDGTLKSVGKLGIPAAESYAFDVQTTADGTNTAWLFAGGALHQVSIETGAVTQSWKLGGLAGGLRDLAILPAD
jgi:outer membrane protein assembly factor BamB